MPYLSKKGKFKTNIYINKELWQKLVKTATAEKSNASKMIEDLVRRSLARKKLFIK